MVDEVEWGLVVALAGGERCREAADCGAYIRARFECCAGGSCPRRKREPVFKWRRALKRGELTSRRRHRRRFFRSWWLLPVERSAVQARLMPRTSAPGGSIHIEFPGRAMISVERGADPSLLRSILESLRK